MKPNHQNLIVAVATAIVIALFAIGCNNRANNAASVATEDSASQSEDKLDSGVNEYEVDNDKDSVITLILSDRDTVRIGATKRNIDFLVNKVGESFDSLVKKISGNYFVNSVDNSVYVSVYANDTIHDINKDGFKDLIIYISASLPEEVEYISKSYFAVYFGDKFAHYNLHDYYCLGEMRTDGGEWYNNLDEFKIDDQGVFHFEKHYSSCLRMSYESNICGGDNTILARYQEGDLYVIGESNSKYSSYSHCELDDEGNFIDTSWVEEVDSYSITRNYLTFEEKDELTGKITELKHAPLKKLSEVFGHKDTHW